MSRRKTIFFVVATTLVIFAVLRLHISSGMAVVKVEKPLTPIAEAKDENLKGKRQIALSSTLASSQLKQKSPIQISSLTEAESKHQTLLSLTTVLAEAMSLNLSPATLVRDLNLIGYQPTASKDDVAYMDSMIVIQTKNALPGSRYFRAQFFGDDEGHYQPQHVSFELQPGTSLKDVTSALTSAFGGSLPAPAYRDREWTSYKFPDGYTVWTKILNSEDIKENAISAHSPEDVGTIQVAIEKEIAGHEDEPL